MCRVKRFVQGGSTIWGWCLSFYRAHKLVNHSRQMLSLALQKFKIQQSPSSPCSPCYLYIACAMSSNVLMCNITPMSCSKITWCKYPKNKHEYSWIYQQTFASKTYTSIFIPLNLAERHTLKRALLLQGIGNGVMGLHFITEPQWWSLSYITIFYFHEIICIECDISPKLC